MGPLLKQVIGGEGVRLRERERSLSTELSPSEEDDKKAPEGLWTAERVLPLTLVVLVTLIGLVVVGGGSSREGQPPELYRFLGRLLWENATVRPPVMLIFVVAGWAWVVHVCRRCGMNIALVLGGKPQPAAAIGFSTRNAAPPSDST